MGSAALLDQGFVNVDKSSVLIVMLQISIATKREMMRPIKKIISLRTKNVLRDFTKVEENLLREYGPRILMRNELWHIQQYLRDL